MGITEVTVEVGNPRDQTQWQTLDLIADTGAIFSVIPRSTLEQLGITPYAEETFTLPTVARSDGRWAMSLSASTGRPEQCR